MTRAISHYVLGALVALFGFAYAASAQDAAAINDPARLAAARDLMEVTGVSKQMDGMMDAMKRGFAKGAKSENSAAGEKLSGEFDATVEKLMSFKKEMIEEFAQLYAATFTAEEMKTVADFYRSGTGAKFIAMTPELMQKGSVIGMRYSERIMNEIKSGKPAQPK